MYKTRYLYIFTSLVGAYLDVFEPLYKPVQTHTGWNSIIYHFTNNKRKKDKKINSPTTESDHTNII